MTFEMVRADGDDLGARVDDVAQEAIDAVALAWSHDPGIDVDAQLRAQLSSRGLAADDATISQVAGEIRDGRSVDVGAPDGSME